MANNHVVPAQERLFGPKGEFLGFYDPPRYRCPDPRQVARGVMPMEFLQGERFLGCSTPDHVRDVLMAEGEYSRPAPEKELMEGQDERWIEAYLERIKGWQQDHDRRRKAARERVKKRRQRMS